jgi:hypothetical protein
MEKAMTPQLLDFDTPKAPVNPDSRLARVAGLFMRRRGEWIDSEELAAIGGRCAWRTRCSECRTLLGMDIETRVRTVHDHDSGCPALQAWDVEGACGCLRQRVYRVSEYRYVK